MFYTTTCIHYQLFSLLIIKINYIDVTDVNNWRDSDLTISILLIARAETLVITELACEVIKDYLL